MLLFLEHQVLYWHPQVKRVHTPTLCSPFPLELDYVLVGVERLTTLLDAPAAQLIIAHLRVAVLPADVHCEEQLVQEEAGEGYQDD